MRRTHYATLLVAALGIVGLLGCDGGISPTVRRTAALQASAVKFAQALRWKRYHICSRFMAEETQDAFDARFTDAVDDLRVTDADVVRIDVGEEAHTAKVRVKLRWTMLPSILENVTMMEQQWESRKGGWVIAQMAEPGLKGNGPLDVL